MSIIFKCISKRFVSDLHRTRRPKSAGTSYLRRARIDRLVPSLSRSAAGSTALANLKTRSAAEAVANLDYGIQVLDCPVGQGVFNRNQASIIGLISM
jgi:hypothetical protein